MDYWQASQAGAALGLQRANMRTQANEAAGRLGLGYAELRARQAAAGASSAGRDSAADALNRYRMAQLEQAGQRQADLNTYRESQLGNVDDRELMAQARLGMAKEQLERSQWQVRTLPGGDLMQVNTVTGDVRPLSEGSGQNIEFLRQQWSAKQREKEKLTSMSNNIMFIGDKKQVDADIERLTRESDQLKSMIDDTIANRNRPRTPAAEGLNGGGSELPGAGTRSAEGGYDIKEVYNEYDEKGNVTRSMRYEGGPIADPASWTDVTGQ